MVQRLTTRGIRTATAIRDMESFVTSGSMSGQKYPDGGLGPGAVYNSWLNEDEKQVWYLHCYAVDYAVWSYATPIAWHWTADDGTSGWHIVKQKFSPTTGKHQSNLYMIREEEVPVLTNEEQALMCVPPSIGGAPSCAEGGMPNDDNPGRPNCRTCDDDPNVAALYPA